MLKEVHSCYNFMCTTLCWYYGYLETTFPNALCFCETVIWEWLDIHYEILLLPCVMISFEKIKLNVSSLDMLVSSLVSTLINTHNHV
jgi:hypothetical protein